MRMTTEEKLQGMSRAETIDRLPFLSLNDPRLRLNIHVTEEDILLSEPGCPTKCAISTALRRMFADAAWVCTRHDKITITIDGRYLHFILPLKASRLIQAFNEMRLDRPAKLAVKLNDVRIVPAVSNDRKEQINDARRRRIADGHPDKKYGPPSLRTSTTKAAKARRAAA